MKTYWILIFCFLTTICFGQDLMLKSSLILETEWSQKSPVDFPSFADDLEYIEISQSVLPGFGIQVCMTKRKNNWLHFGISSGYRRSQIREERIHNGITGGGNKYRSKRILNSISLAPVMVFEVRTNSVNKLLFYSSIRLDQSIKRISYKHLSTNFNRYPAYIIQHKALIF